MKLRCRSLAKISLRASRTARFRPCAASTSLYYRSRWASLSTERSSELSTSTSPFSRSVPPVTVSFVLVVVDFVIPPFLSFAHTRMYCNAHSPLLRYDEEVGRNSKEKGEDGSAASFFELSDRQRCGTSSSPSRAEGRPGKIERGEQRPTSARPPLSFSSTSPLRSKFPQAAVRSATAPLSQP